MLTWGITHDWHVITHIYFISDARLTLSDSLKYATSNNIAGNVLHTTIRHWIRIVLQLNVTRQHTPSRDWSRVVTSRNVLYLVKFQTLIVEKLAIFKSKYFNTHMAQNFYVFVSNFMRNRFLNRNFYDKNCVNAPSVIDRFFKTFEHSSEIFEDLSHLWEQTNDNFVSLRCEGDKLRKWNKYVLS